MASKIILFLFSLYLFFFPKAAFAQSNKFGIHILNENQLPKARELVNSSGGDWGYVTVVIREDEIDHDRWQRFFDESRVNHLIPLVRIATYQKDSFWAKPKEEIIEKWVSFLGGLNWPVKDQYVIVYNEPNHDAEWDGESNPREYARILDKTIQVFKNKNPNFQILNAGFDLAAPNSSKTMDVVNFWQKMNKEIPGIFTKLDGWVSHSYPNYGFVGTPAQKGRTSISGYRWELTTLKQKFGLDKEVPVFITETGWPYQLEKKEEFYTQEIGAFFIKDAFEKVWLPDERVKAVTPFLLSYDQKPFANFSWVDKDNQNTPQFETVKNIPKIFWWPEQEFKYQVETIYLPSFLPTNTEYRGTMVLVNTGQSIWGEKDKFRINPKAQTSLTLSSLELPEETRVKPSEKVEIGFVMKTGATPEEVAYSWDEFPEYKIKVLPSSVITQARFRFWERVSLWLKKNLI